MQMESAMPYVKRNEQGKVVQLLDISSNEHSEWLEVSDEEVVDFLHQSPKADDLLKVLSGSDGSMVRVVEDVVDLLLQKQIFNFTELPEAVQSKLNERKKLRHEVNALSNLIAEDDNIL
jgi:hypothetical protein